jgi:hypothetical protein
VRRHPEPIMSRTLRLTAAPLIGLLLLVACAAPSGQATDTPRSDPGAADLDAADGVIVTVHRSESCECCGVYEKYLEATGFTVEQVVHEDMQAVKAAFGVPEGSWSCHTNEVGGYAAEGHVPAQALLQMLAEADDIDGITLPGMPAGSPGMPGDQDEPFVVLTFIDGRLNGELGSF